GGGIFFWWQAGVVRALQQHYDLQGPHFTMSGASAGSISCVMAACNVDMDHAMDAAMRLAHEAGLFTRTCGLMGIWGDLIEKWMHEMLPADCHVICSGKVNISVTAISASFTPLHRRIINTFVSKQDVIDACLTSAHIPYALDGFFSRKYRGEMCVDGSFLFFLHGIPWCVSELFDGEDNALLLHHCKDSELLKHHWGVLQAIDQTSLKQMFSLGYAYGIRL
ncbi:hypothetical protein T484DRAFT_1549519, partial [Baffinella frigidus]